MRSIWMALNKRLDYCTVVPLPDLMHIAYENDGNRCPTHTRTVHRKRREETTTTTLDADVPRFRALLSGGVRFLINLNLKACVV